MTQKSALARELYERVFAHMELEERDYFGMSFLIFRGGGDKGKFGTILFAMRKME